MRARGHTVDDDHNRGEDPGHDHDHSHEHGHSHRTGAATRYWREPKPVAVTVVVFLVLLLLNYPRRSPMVLKRHTNDFDDIPLVLWHDGSLPPIKQNSKVRLRRMGDTMEPTCQYANITISGAPIEEVSRVHATYCSTPECLWSMYLMFSNARVKFLVSEDLFLSISTNKDFGQIANIAAVDAVRLDDFIDQRVLQGIQSVALVKPLVTCKRYPLASAYPAKILDCKKPGDRSCDRECGTPKYFYRSDLLACISVSPCNLLTTAACLDTGIHTRCERDCQDIFALSIRTESTRNSTVTISLVTLFLLGLVLGLLFAKLYWVDPLLDTNERLQTRLGNLDMVSGG